MNKTKNDSTQDSDFRKYSVEEILQMPGFTKKRFTKQNHFSKIGIAGQTDWPGSETLPHDFRKQWEVH